MTYLCGINGATTKARSLFFVCVCVSHQRRQSTCILYAHVCTMQQIIFFTQTRTAEKTLSTNANTNELQSTTQPRIQHEQTKCLNQCKRYISYEKKKKTYKKWDEKTVRRVRSKQHQYSVSGHQLSSNKQKMRSTF